MTEKAWIKFHEPTVNVAAPFIGMAVRAKIENCKMGQAKTIVLKSVSGNTILTVTDQHIGD